VVLRKISSVMGPVPSWLDSLPSFFQSAKRLFSPVHPIKVQSVKDWRAQTKAERATGQMPTIKVALFRCDRCRVGIGFNHTEGDMYIYHVLNQIVGVGDTKRYFRDDWLKVCGGCAHRKEGRNCPGAVQILWPEDYMTYKLIDGSSRAINVTDLITMQQVREAVRIHVLLAEREITGKTGNPVLVQARVAPPKPVMPVPPLAPRRTYSTLSRFSLFGSALSTTQKMRAMAGSLVLERKERVTTKNAS